jgi:hypothetical protein
MLALANRRPWNRTSFPVFFCAGSKEGDAAECIERKPHGVKAVFSRVRLVRACVRRLAKSISEGQRGMGVRRIHRGVLSRKYYLRYPSETIVIAAATAYACISITFHFSRPQ